MGGYGFHGKQVRVGLYTIPHTGTRFVMEILRHLGADVNQRHVNCDPVVPEHRKVLTLRHPHKVYLTHQYKYVKKTETEFISMYLEYLFRTEHMDAFYFPLEGAEDNREGVIQRLQAWCGLPTDYDKVRAFEWKTVGASGRPETEVPPEMVEALKPAVEWYEHYMLNWGPHMRHPMNLIGDR